MTHLPQLDKASQHVLGRTDTKLGWERPQVDTRHVEAAVLATGAKARPFRMRSVVEAWAGAGFLAGAGANIRCVATGEDITGID